MDAIFAALERVGLVPVIKIDRAADAVPLARALSVGGLPVAEITFRTPAAAEAIRRIAAEVPDLILGAGTVLTMEQAAQAMAAGAQYLVSPGFDPQIVDWCRAHALPMLPGVATSTEILMALNKGCSVLKFFPAEELGGTGMLKALAGPFTEVRFIPTGGITAANLSAYLRLPNVVAAGGSWMAPAALIAAGRFDEISRLAAEACAIVAAARAESEAAR